MVESTVSFPCAWLAVAALSFAASFSWVIAGTISRAAVVAAFRMTAALMSSSSATIGGHAALCAVGYIQVDAAVVFLHGLAAASGLLLAYWVSQGHWLIELPTRFGGGARVRPGH